MSDAVDILLVDDEPRNLIALDAILSDPAYRLLHANDADEALGHLVERDVAVIVLDVMMPGTDGYALAKIIRNTRRFRQTPIVFLTAHMVDDRDVLEGYVAGGVDYLSKPVNPRILRQKIDIFVELFRSRREIAELNRSLEDRVRERTADLERSEARLRDVDSQRTAFLATLAHELRNPLAPLRTGLDLIARQPATPAPAPLIDGMTRQMGYLVRLVDDLLDASRASRGVLHLKKAPVDLQGVVESAIAMARPNVVRRSQSLVFEHSDLEIRTVVDETRICQIVSNLLDNASKFSPPGGEIRVSLRAEDGSAVVAVSDRGPGIPSSQIDRVFDMFTTIDRSGGSAGGGLGIGLALSRKLAELHDGVLTAESRGEGLGATFTLRLPIDVSRWQAAEADAPKSARVRSDRPPAGTASSRPLGVVVIEDNQDSADILAMWLVATGHRVDVAHTGPEGLELVIRRRPDVVLCDIGLPDIDGVEICRRVKQELATPPTMVALTGWGTDRDRERTHDAGFDHHLVKPVQPDQLRALLATLTPRDAAA